MKKILFLFTLIFITNLSLSKAFGFSFLGSHYQTIKSGCLNTAKNLTLSYGCLWSSVLFHELGHYIAAKALTQGPVELHLGGKPRDIKSSYILNLKNMLFMHSLNPVKGGYIVYNRPDNPWKSIAVSLAGPVFGCTVDLALLYILLKKTNKYSYLLPKILCIHGAVNNLAQLIPFSIPGAFTTDGAHILGEFRKIKSLKSYRF